MGSLRSSLRRARRSADRLVADTGAIVEDLLGRDRCADLAVFDDAFPDLFSGFRIAEFNHYLRALPDARVYTTLNRSRLTGDGRRAVLARYAAAHPELATRVRRFHPRRAVEARAAYTVFLNNAAAFVDYFERRGLPFAFTLYPGGGMQVDQEPCDRKLARVLGSPLLHKVIVTQRLTRDYLLERHGFPADRVELVFGGVFPSDALAGDVPRRRYGRDKTTLDLCFVAHKYTPGGVDKGYDLFLETARRLVGRHADLRLHVVGPWSPSDGDLRGLEPRITFYGPRPTAFFPELYARMDAILSPNRPGLRAPGDFDGFPLGCCIEAALCGVAVFATDPLDLNLAFTDGEHLEIVPPDADAIADRLGGWLERPDDLARLGRAGARAFREVFDIDRQMEPRLRILSECTTA